MKFKTLSAMCLAATSVLAASSAMAWESEDGAHSTSASVALSTEYVWRGISQTDKDPAISGSFDYAHSSGFYAGTWASSYDFDDEASSEVDIYAGFAGEFGESGLGYDVGVLRYIFPGEDYNWNEVYGSLSYGIFTAGIAYSADTLGSDETGVYYSLGASYDLPMGVTLAAGAGYYDADENTFTDDEDGYANYYIGVSKEVAGFGLDLTYSDTDSSAEDIYGDRADDRFIFTISKSM